MYWKQRLSPSWNHWGRSLPRTLSPISTCHRWIIPPWTALLCGRMILEEPAKQRANEVAVFSETRPDQNIRLAGEDISRGKIVLRKDTVIRPAEMGMMAAMGHSRVKVIRRPVVAVLSTGNELVEVDKPLPGGKIHDSNAYSIASLVKRYGCIPIMLGISRDDG